MRDDHAYAAAVPARREQQQEQEEEEEEQQQQQQQEKDYNAQEEQRVFVLLKFWGRSKFDGATCKQHVGQSNNLTSCGAGDGDDFSSNVWSSSSSSFLPTRTTTLASICCEQHSFIHSFIIEISSFVVICQSCSPPPPLPPLPRLWLL